MLSHLRELLQVFLEVPEVQMAVLIQITWVTKCTWHVWLKQVVTMPITQKTEDWLISMQ